MPKYQTGGDESQRRQRVRIAVLATCFALGFGSLICRAAYFHLKEDGKLEKLALQQYKTAVKQSSLRGFIRDQAGRDLAINVPVDSLFANPQVVTEPKKTAAKLAKLLHVDAKKIAERLSGKRKFVWIKRQASPEEAKAVSELKLPGVYSMDEYKRAYPNGKLAAQILGAVGVDAEALGGVELKYHDFLLSRFSEGNFRRDARGHLYLSPTDLTDTEPQLSELQLTIDKTLQYVAERELEAAVDFAQAKAGVAIVMDVQSGEVLAMANYPFFDPNHYRDYPAESWRDRAVSDAFEPGSTFKVLVIAAALEKGLVRASDTFDCENGDMKLGKHTIHDTHPHGVLDIGGILQVSSNIGAAKVGKKMSAMTMYRELAAFGIGQKMNTGLPAEAQGILSSGDRWSDVQHATVSFGQGVSATPLHLTSAFAAIANGGELLRPRLIKRMTDAAGQVVFESQREVLARPISPPTSRLMGRLLEKVVLPGGTGTEAASREYALAGKTGTAQKVEPNGKGYADGKYYSSFIGFAPLEAPRIVVYVGIDEPAGLYYGGQVAAPAFRKITEASLHYLKVPAKLPRGQQVLEAEYVPLVLAPAEIEVADAANAQPFRQQTDGRWQVPNLRGLSARSVFELLGAAELKVQMEGSGLVQSQFPEPGTLLPNGAELKISLKNML